MRAAALIFLLLTGCAATCVCESQHMKVGRMATMARGDLDEFLVGCAEACKQ